MWLSISQEKKKEHQYSHAFFVGAGVSSNAIIRKIDDVPKTYCCRIALNRSIVLLDRFDYLFVDSPIVIKEVEEYITRCNYIVCPIFSRGDFNINSKIAIKYKHKILFYYWVYNNDEFLNHCDYPLNDDGLFINWGVYHSALHFVNKIFKIKNIYSIGCDGKTNGSKIYAEEIEERFRIPSSIKKRRKSSYNNIVDKLPEIKKRLGIEIVNL